MRRASWPARPRAWPTPAFARERNPRGMSDDEPAGSACLPGESAGEFADAVEIAFQIRECKFARRFVNCFLAREAGGAERQHGRFDRLAIAQLVRLADFEQAQIALAVIQIPFERADHADDSRRAHHGGVFRERIADHCGGHALGAENFVAPRIHQRNRRQFPDSRARSTRSRRRSCASACGRRCAGCFAGGSRGGNLS